MAVQTNYFAYNIIDDIYYGTPNEEEMIDIYGKAYHRRSEYNNLTPEQKENFQQEEKEFIQAVINRYILDSNNKISYVGRYTENNNISYTYISENSYMPIQISDMISNINGMHLYKLISAKDIDFDNVILPNSAITRDYNWGLFDEKRRWGNKPIHINNTFELLNVIDYLLCACNNIWNELYKLKYGDEDNTNLWFIVKADSSLMILESRKIANDDFKKENIGKHEVKVLTTLDPTQYYSTVKTINNGLFGFGTNFHKTDSDTSDLYFQYRILNNKSSKNIITGNIEPESLVTNPSAQVTQVINGEPYTIYGYKIGDDLKIYPGERIKSVINESSLITDIEELVDINTKKLKYDTYFRLNVSTFKQIYVEFLFNYSTNSNNKNLHSSEKHPYILYYIDSQNKKHVLSVHTLTSIDDASKTGVIPTTKVMSEESILFELSSHEDYNISELYNNGIINVTDRFNPGDNFIKNLNVKGKVTPSEDDPTVFEEKYEPIYYIIPDEYSLQFEVTLPKSYKSKGIIIYYYKNENNINGNIYLAKDLNYTFNINDFNDIENNDNLLEILPSIDSEQSSSVSYCLERYNIPENQDVYFKINATYIANGNENPLGLKLDDEYNDICLFNNELNTINNDNINEYYYYDSISSNYSRNFKNYISVENFTNNIGRYINYDLNGNEFYHVWKKIETPYKVIPSITTSSLISQTITYDEANSEVFNIKNNTNSLQQISYNLFKFNYSLPEEIEQLKFDIDFVINETSKVKKCYYKYPINLNKIYEITINYIGNDIIHNEANKYNTDKYNYTQYLPNDNESIMKLSNVLNVIGSTKYWRSVSTNDNRISYLDVIKSLNNNNSLSDLDDIRTYDNTIGDIDSKIFKISYSTTKKYINLLGSFYTGKLLNITSNNNKYASISIGNQDIVQNSSYLFNINGLGINYRLHGYNEYIDNSGTEANSKIIVSSYFDLLSVKLQNKKNSINTFLNFKLIEDGNEQYQLSYIAYNNTDNIYEWTKYDNNFNSGYEENNIYTIKTIPVDIIKSTYELVVYNHKKNSVNNYITYYIPISYMVINTSTFYPPIDTRPIGEYDFNKEEDKIRYKNYVECWNNNNNYKPITLSLKLLENNNNISPYFKESNEAKIRFNILRSDDANQTNLSIGGKQQIIFIALNSKYYLSDFIDFNGGQFNQNGYPTGSYFYFNKTTYSYMINEIYGNQYNNIYINNNEIKNNLNYPTIDTIDNANKLVIYPVFKKSANNNDYNYNINRIADTNKLIIRNDNEKEKQVNILLNATDEQNNNIYINNQYFNVDYILKCIDFFNENDLLYNLCNSFVVNNELKTAFLNIPLIDSSQGIDPIYNSKNYTHPVLTISGGSTKTSIMPIYRRKSSISFVSNNVDLNNFSLYTSVLINNDVYEFFEFKYDDIYLLSQNKSNNKIQEVSNIELFKKSNENSEDNTPSEEELKQYYINQLIYFLKNDNNDTQYRYLLCNKEIRDELLSDNND